MNVLGLWILVSAVAFAVWSFLIWREVWTQNRSLWHRCRWCQTLVREPHTMCRECRAKRQQAEQRAPEWMNANRRNTTSAHWRN